MKTNKTTTSLLLGSTLLLLAGASACSAEPEETLDEGALTFDDSVQTIEPNAPGQTVFDGVGVGSAVADDPELPLRKLAVSTYSAAFASQLEAAESASSTSTLSGDTPAGGVTTSAAAARAGRTVSIRGEKQQTPYYCVPASSRITLSALMSSPPSQATLARRENTTAANGTYMRYVPAALNAYQTRNHFLLSTDTVNASDLVSRVRYDIDQLHSPLIPALQGSYLPAWKARGYSGRHGIVIYGWNVATKQPYYLNLYDPLNVSWSGPYNVLASTVHTAMKANRNELVW